MSSTYSNSLRIELIGSGDQAGAWGATTDSNLAYVLDTSIAGYQAVAISSTAQALTYVNGPSSSASLNQSVYAMLSFTGASAATSIYAPPVSKQYILWNNTSYAITIYNSTVIGNTTAAGTGVTLSAGDKIQVWSDGTNFYDVKAPGLTSTLGIANGGTGQVTANAAFNALAPAQTAATTTNKYLKSDGTNTSWDLINLSSTTTVTAGSFVVGTSYTILSVGTTDFTLIGAASNTVGGVFTATGVGAGTGTAYVADYAGVLPVIAGGSGTTTSTGTGNLVLSSSPTLSTPRVSGSSTGYTTIASANAGATNYTATLPTENFTVGFRNIPAVGTKTSSYTLTTSDVGKYVQIGSGGSIIIPDAVFSEGDVVSLFNNTSGSITITCSITTAYISGVDSDKATMTLVTRGVATILFISGTVCVVSGLVS